MTTQSTSTDDRHTTGPESSGPDQPLGWEGHVHMPEGQPGLAKLLGNWPELRSGLAFSLVFVVGALVGGSLAALFICQNRKVRSDR